MTRIKVAGLALPLALALGACADDGGGEGAGDSRTTQPTSQTPGEGGRDLGAVPATRVDFTRSGGIAGEETSYTFAAGQRPPQGFDPAERDAVLAAASARALHGLDVPSVPKDPCCDLFTYEVTIHWSDGSSRTYTTVDGVQVPAALQKLLDAAQR